MADKNSHNSTDTSVVTVDVQPFLLPIALVMSTIIFSISFLIGMNMIADGTGGSSNKDTSAADTVDADTGTTTGTTTGTAPAAAPVAVTAGQTNIDDDAIKGDKDKAKVAIVEFSDYECPFCKRHFQQTYSQIVENFVNSGDAIIVYRDFPLSFHDPLASKQALAAECVGDLEGDDKYYEYHDLLFENTASNGNGMQESKLPELAKQIGVDEGDFKECYDSGKFTEEIKKDLADGQAAGVSGTPGFVVGVLSDDGSVKGEVVSGAQPYSAFEAAINRQLEAAE